MVCISCWLYVWNEMFDSLSWYEIGIWIWYFFSLCALMSISMEFIQFYSHNWKKDKIKIIVMIIVIIINGRKKNNNSETERRNEKWKRREWKTKKKLYLCQVSSCFPLLFSVKSTKINEIIMLLSSFYLLYRHFSFFSSFSSVQLLSDFYNCYHNDHIIVILNKNKQTIRKM